jgi:hypothetical protein
MIKSILEEMKKNIINEVIKIIIEMENEKIDGVKIKDIMEMISGGGEDKRIVNIK